MSSPRESAADEQFLTSQPVPPTEPSPQNQSATAGAPRIAAGLYLKCQPKQDDEAESVREEQPPVCLTMIRLWRRTLEPVSGYVEVPWTRRQPGH